MIWSWQAIAQRVAYMCHGKTSVRARNSNEMLRVIRERERVEEEAGLKCWASCDDLRYLNYAHRIIPIEEQLLWRHCECLWLRVGMMLDQS